MNSEESKNLKGGRTLARLERKNELAETEIVESGSLLKSFLEICKAWRAIPAFLAGSYGILGTSLGALEHPLGVSGGILVVFGRL